MNDFTVKHPEYQRWYHRWLKAHDFYRGGLHVLTPERAAVHVRFYRRTSGDSDKPVYEDRLQASYLLSHPRESYDCWIDRHERAEHFPILRPIINIFASSLFRVAPTRTLPGGAPLTPDWQAWVDDIDGNGRSLSNLAKAAVSWGLAFGRCFAVTDMPRIDRAPRSEAERRQMRLEPYTYLITPLELVDWQTDREGFVWAVLEETVPDTRAPGDTPDKQEYQYRVWTRTRWELYRRKTNTKGRKLKGYELVDGDEHGLGFVPIQPFFADKTEGLGSLECDTPIASVLDIDFACFNLLSLLDEQENQSTFPQLTVEDDGGHEPIEVGPGTALTFPQGGQRPEYIGPDPSISKGLFERILARIEVARKAGNSSRGRAEWSKEERSADALGMEYQDRYALLAGLADAAEDLENGIMAHRAAWMRQSAYPISQYPRRFDLRTIQQQINDATKINSLPVGDEAKRVVNANLVDRFLKESGVDDKTREGAVKGALEAALDVGDGQNKDVATAGTGVVHETSLDVKSEVALISFGFTYGVPEEADVVVDVRFLPSPGTELRKRSGLDAEVASFVLNQDGTDALVDHAVSYIEWLLLNLDPAKGKITLGVGCVAGRHRSVAIVEEIARRFGGRGVSVRHRDIDKKWTRS